jgi:hypothetical protein
MRAITLLILALVWLALGWPLAAQSDASIVLDSPEGETLIKVRDGHVRISESQDASTVMVFNAPDNTLVLLDASRRTYTRIDEDSARAIRGQLEAAIKEAEEQIQALPPQQQEMMRSMMADLLNYGDKVPRVEVQRDGGQAVVEGITCQRVTVTYDGAPGMEACVANAEELGISEADNDAVIAMFAFLTDFANTVMPSDGSGWELSGMEGIPVEARDLDDGQVSRLKSVNTDALDPALFSVPDGYTEQALRIE